MKDNDTILVIENGHDQSASWRSILEKSGWPVTTVLFTDRLENVVAFLSMTTPMSIFLDLNLSENDGFTTFLSVYALARDIPIIIIAQKADSSLSLQLVQAGAQDFLVRDDFDERMLVKAMRYSIERKKNQLKLEEINKRFEFASKATNDPLWDWDLATNEIVWNDRVTIFGYPSALRKNISWWKATIHPADQERVISKIYYFIANDYSQWSDDYRFICADGTFKYIHDRGYILRDKNNSPYRMIGSMQDVSDQMLLQKKLVEESARQQKAILKATIEGQEQERNFIGKELHDNINQILSSTNLYLSMAQTAKPHAFQEIIPKVQQNVNAAIEEIRKLSKRMVASEVNDIGLAEAMQSLTADINFTSKIQINFSHSGDLTRVAPGVNMTIFRISQEQLNNILKHSTATEAHLKLHVREKKLTLEISDNGIGTDWSAKKSGIGLSNIQNRIQAYNGDFHIDTATGKGFKMLVELPLA